MFREAVWGMNNEICTSQPQLSIMTHFKELKICFEPSKPIFPKFSGKFNN